MLFQQGHIYHIFNQGNNRNTLFFEKSDYELFLRKLRIAFLPHSSILCWCLMPNHFHVLIIVHDNYQYDSDLNEGSKKLNPLNKAIGSLLSSYSQRINRKYNRSGSLFRKRTKSKPLNNDSGAHNEYLMNCFLYIHQNPLRAGLIENLEDWEYSSFMDYSGLRNGSLCNKELALELLGISNSAINFKEFSHQTIPPYYLQKFDD